MLRSVKLFVGNVPYCLLLIIGKCFYLVEIVVMLSVGILFFGEIFCLYLLVFFHNGSLIKYFLGYGFSFLLKIASASRFVLDMDWL